MAETDTSKILAFAGSLRQGSYNKKLARFAAQQVDQAGGDVTVIDLRDYPMPIYDGDIEQEHGLPENAIKLQQLFDDHDGLLIASPEYNSSITAVLKNTIDWVSRPRENRPGLKSFDGKVAALISASPGALGGLRGLFTLRSILSNIRVLVLPQMLAVSGAADKFDENDQLTDEKEAGTIADIARQLVTTVSKLKQPDA